MLEDTIDDIEVHPDLLSRNNWQLKQQENDNDQDVESIESIPFIAEPAKKKRTRSTK